MKHKSTVSSSIIILLLILPVVTFMNSELQSSPQQIANAQVGTLIPNLQGNKNENLNVPLSSTTIYRDSAHILHIVGQIQNNFRFPINSVQIAATLYDSNNRVVDTGATYSHIDQLRPGEKSGFDIVFSNAGANFANYALSTSYEVAQETKPASLILSMGQGYVDSVGNYHLVGEITNQGSSTAKFLKVGGVYFDSNYKVVDATFAYTIPRDLQAGQKASFQLIAISPESNHIKYALLNAQSDEYSLMNLESSPILLQTKYQNSATTSAETETSSSHKMSISIGVAKDPITTGSKQTITVTASDASNSAKKIGGADVHGGVMYASGKNTEPLSGTTDSKGKYVHGWKIGPNSDTGTFKVSVQVSASGYKSSSASKTFQVIAATGKNNTQNQNSTNNNGTNSIGGNTTNNIVNYTKSPNNSGNTLRAKNNTGMTASNNNNSSNGSNTNNGKSRSSNSGINDKSSAANLASPSTEKDCTANPTAPGCTVQQQPSGSTATTINDHDQDDSTPTTEQGSSSSSQSNSPSTNDHDKDDSASSSNSNNNNNGGSPSDNSVSKGK